MVDNSPDSLHNNPKKKTNPFKKILDDVKKFMKKDEEKDKKPSSFEAPKKGKKEKDKKPSSFKESKKEKSPELNQQPEDSNIPKIETPETKEAERSMRERKGKIKEQKLPKKYRKGW
jgi:hypothetical protein